MVLESLRNPECTSPVAVASRKILLAFAWALTCSMGFEGSF